MQIRDHFSKVELQQLLARSDAQAWLAVLTSWVLVALAFALVALWPNLLTILLALIVIGGRQLGFGALMHECGHGSLFATKGLNSWVGKWLCAGPVMYRIDDYMVRHLLHHRTVGTAEDPDLSRYQAYPVTRASLRRKLIRDLTGRTTMKFLRDLLKANATIETEDGQRSLRLVLFFRACARPLSAIWCCFRFLQAWVRRRFTCSGWQPISALTCCFREFATWRNMQQCQISPIAIRY